MSEIVAKLTLKDSCGNVSTLLVIIKENQMVNYNLYGAKSRISLAISNLQVKKPLPDLLLDYDDVKRMIEDIKAAITSGVKTVTDVKIYS